MSTTLRIARRALPCLCLLAGSAAAAEPAPEPAFRALRPAADGSLKPKLTRPAPSPVRHVLHAHVYPDGSLAIDCSQAPNHAHVAHAHERFAEEQPK